MILSFKQQFKVPILEGAKIHTIRNDKSNRWRTGKKIHFATGVRTKYYDQFFEGECVSTQDIEINVYRDNVVGTCMVIIIDGRIIKDLKEISRLATNDGFVNIKEFYSWFNKSFKGKIIHWTDYKY